MPMAWSQTTSKTFPCLVEGIWKLDLEIPKHFGISTFAQKLENAVIITTGGEKKEVSRNFYQTLAPQNCLRH